MCHPLTLFRLEAPSVIFTALHAFLKKRVTTPPKHIEFHRVSSVVAEQSGGIPALPSGDRREPGPRQATRSERCDLRSQRPCRQCL